MNAKDLLYLVMFYILKNRGQNNDYLFDLYELVVDTVSSLYPSAVSAGSSFDVCVSVLRSKCLSMRCAKTVLSFCKFAEKFAKILKNS